MIRAIYKGVGKNEVKQCLVVEYLERAKAVVIYTLTLIFVPGKPFLTENCSIAKRDYVQYTSNVDGCVFLDVIGQEFKQGAIYEISLEDDPDEYTITI